MTDTWLRVPDASYFAYLWWTREIRGKRTLSRRKVRGIPIPGLPSLKIAKNEIKCLAIGQWNKAQRLEDVLLPLGKQAQLFAAGHFPIGKIWMTKEAGIETTCYASRVVPLATALTWLIVNAENKQLFKLQLNVRLFCIHSPLLFN